MTTTNVAVHLPDHDTIAPTAHAYGVDLTTVAVEFAGVTVFLSNREQAAILAAAFQDAIRLLPDLESADDALEYDGDEYARSTAQALARENGHTWDLYAPLVRAAALHAGMVQP